MPSCTSCGRTAAEGVEFCSYCGCSLAPQQPPPAPPFEQATTAFWVCPACSVENEEGNSFCQSCGSAPRSGAAASATAATGPAVAPCPAVAPARQSPQATAAATPPGPAWACLACGTVNDGDARFCYSCGSLAGSMPAPGGVAAGAPPGTARGRSAIIIVVALVALALVGVVGGLILLTGGGDNAANGGGSASAAGAGSSAAGDGTGAVDTTDTTGTTDGTSSSPSAHDITYLCSRVRATSTLGAAGDNHYTASHLTDGALVTAWAEGSPGYGIGARVRFAFSEKVVLTEMVVAPGYFKTVGGWDRWQTNGRLHRVRLRFSDGTTSTFSFSDTRSQQSRDLGETSTSWVEMEILQVYRPSPYNSDSGHNASDTSVSEVKFTGWARSGETP